MLTGFADVSQRLAGNPLAALPVLFAAGVLTSLTPCIYPMIPITAAIVGGGSVGTTRRRGAALTLAYVLGLSLVYAALGLVAGLTHTIFGTVSSSAWAAMLTGNLLLLFGLWMLDAIQLRLPALLLGGARTPPINSIGGAFTLGCASGLVAAPCSAPVMAAVLTWVAATKSAVAGFFYLWVFSLGMCALLVVVGLFGATMTTLPRAGAWMVWVKRALAVVLIGAAEYYFVHAGMVL